MKHYFISMSIFAFLFICSACSNENGIGREDEIGGSRLPLIIHATANSFDNLPDVKHSITRSTEDGLNTQFAQDDAIGIFAIKNVGTEEAVIVDDINNTKLTYDKETGWNTDTKTPIYWYDGVSYIAYYPYKEGITIEITKTNDEIIASLAANTGLQPALDQSDAGKYTASDLMTASATPMYDIDNPAKQILTLNFVHQFVLLVLKPQVLMPCSAPTDAGFTYTSGATCPNIDMEATDISLNGVTPYKMDDGIYRAIVLPNENAQITGNYKTTDGASTNADKTINYSGMKIGFSAGTCYTLEVNSPFIRKESVQRLLVPGDFVFHGNGNIEIYPGNGPLTDGKIPNYENAVGIVVTCDQERIDSECKNNGWTHAYVMGLEDVTGGPWGPFAATDGLESIPRTDAKDHMIGYSETNIMLNMLKGMLETAKGDEAKVGDIEKTYSAFYNFNIYRDKNPVPSTLENVRSMWFIPSCGQLYDMLKNLCGKSPDDFRDSPGDYWVDYNYGPEMCSKINNQLEKVNKVFVQYDENRKRFKEGYFWSVSQHSTPTRAWCCTFGISPNGQNSSLLGPGNKNTEQASRIRPFFAF